MFHSRQKAHFILALAFCAVAAAFPQAHAQDAGPAPLVTIKLADMGSESASAEVRHIADWAVNSGDHAGLPFAIVDKLDGRVFVFDAQGKLRGASPALVGSARGDQAAADIGTRQISAIRPEERITPAGRFTAVMGKGMKGEDILWVDYDSALALHRVVTNVPQERRLQRLQSKVAADRRITYGCINVPVQFYDSVVRTTFGDTRSVVYILPESQRAQELFGSYEVRSPFPQNAASVLPAVH